jgi:hypothetical protein
MRAAMWDVNEQHRRNGQLHGQRPSGGVEREPPATPFGDAVAALRAVVARHYRDDMPEEAVRRDLGSVVRAARARRVPAEQIVIAAKTVWYSWPAVRQQPATAAHVRGLERLVSLCVERYAAEPGD